MAGDYQHGAPRLNFVYPQAEEIRDAFARHGVRYLFQSGLILLGYFKA